MVTVGQKKGTVLAWIPYIIDPLWRGRIWAACDRALDGPIQSPDDDRGPATKRKVAVGITIDLLVESMLDIATVR